MGACLPAREVGLLPLSPLTTITASRRHAAAGARGAQRDCKTSPCANPTLCAATHLRQSFWWVCSHCQGRRTLNWCKAGQRLLIFVIEGVLPGQRHWLHFSMVDYSQLRTNEA